MDEVAITIIGAGAVGLAVAAELSRSNTDIVVLERHDSFGRETSSRNSEVIHAGIYYPAGSLKARLCVEGQELLYAFCRQQGITHRQLGKLIVVVTVEEIPRLEELLRKGRANGIRDLQLLTAAEVGDIEPHVRVQAGLLSPSTGIFDSHCFMKALAGQAQAAGVQIAYSTECTAIEPGKDGYRITVREPSGSAYQFRSRWVVNCAGLSANRIAALAGISDASYRIHYCKGSYFRVHKNKTRFTNRLIYPEPDPAGVSLGIHTALDVAGGLRLGPDAEYIQEQDYTVDPTKQQLFYDEVRRFLPFIELDDLGPDQAGIRPKLQGPGEGFRDFIIQEESGRGLPGLINLIGIESPGLTASLAIGRSVRAMIS